VALIRTDVSEGRIASIFRVPECEQVTERSCKLLYRQRLENGVVLIRATRCHLPEDDNHHSHRRGNLKSYIVLYILIFMFLDSRREDKRFWTERLRELPECNDTHKYLNI
jgi:hypothetical protein